MKEHLNMKLLVGSKIVILINSCLTNTNTNQSDNGVNLLNNAIKAFEGRFVILSLLNHVKVSFGGSVFH